MSSGAAGWPLFISRDRSVSIGLCALKTISAPLAADAHGQERFRREARAIAQLEHPRIVSIHDIGTSGGAMYYTMDYIAGADLGRAMRRADDPAPRSGFDRAASGGSSRACKRARSVYIAI